MTRFSTRIGAALAVVALLSVAAWRAAGQQLAQSAASSRTGQHPEGATIPQEVVYSSRQLSPQQQLQRKTAALLEKYKVADTGLARSTAEQALRAALADYFDLLMAEREKQLAELKARLEKLTEQLEQRRKAKDEIVDLRLKVLINEAKGLGFYPDSDGRRTPNAAGPGRPFRYILPE